MKPDIFVKYARGKFGVDSTDAAKEKIDECVNTLKKPAADLPAPTPPNTDELDALKRENNALKKQIEDLRKTISPQQNPSADELKALRTENDDLKKENNDLKLQIAKIKAELEELRKTTPSQPNTQNTSEDELNALRDQIKLLKANFGAMEAHYLDEISKLKSQLHPDLTGKYNILMSQFLALQITYQNLEKTCALKGPCAPCPICPNPTSDQLTNKNAIAQRLMGILSDMDSMKKIINTSPCCLSTSTELTSQQ